MQLGSAAARRSHSLHSVFDRTVDLCQSVTDKIMSLAHDATTIVDTLYKRDTFSVVS